VNAGLTTANQEWALDFVCDAQQSALKTGVSVLLRGRH